MAAVAPPALTYDHLPAHSELVRELSALESGGVELKIVSPAREPSRHIRGLIARETAIPAALVCILILTIFFMMFATPIMQAIGVRTRTMSVSIALIFSIFCAALFAL